MSVDMSKILLPERLEDLPTPAEMASMSGLDFMTAIAEGRLPAAPMAPTMGLALDEVAKGRVVFSGTPEFRHMNPMGGIHGGWYGTILDSALGCAVMTTLPKGQGYTTLEYKVNLVRAARPDVGLRCTAEVEHAGRRTAVASGRVEDASGKLYATGSTTCMIFEIPV